MIFLHKVLKYVRTHSFPNSEVMNFSFYFILFQVPLGAGQIVPSEFLSQDLLTLQGFDLAKLDMGCLGMTYGDINVLAGLRGSDLERKVASCQWQAVDL